MTPRPFAASELAVCAVMADLGERASNTTFRRLMETVREMQREERRLRETIAEMMTNPTIPPGR